MLWLQRSTTGSLAQMPAGLSSDDVLAAVMLSSCCRCPIEPLDVLNFPFFLLGDASSPPNVDECRQAQPPSLTNCSAAFPTYKGGYGIDVVASANLTAAAPIIGCIKSTATACQWPGYQFALMSATGALQGCRQATTCPASGPFSLPLQDLTGAILQGCADIASTGDCPLAGPWQLGIYAKAASSSAAELTACRSGSGGLSDCQAAGLNTTYSVEVTGTVDNILRGCLASNTLVRDSGRTAALAMQYVPL